MPISFFCLQFSKSLWGVAVPSLGHTIFRGCVGWSLGKQSKDHLQWPHMIRPLDPSSVTVRRSSQEECGLGSDAVVNSAGVAGTSSHPVALFPDAQSVFSRKESLAAHLHGSTETSHICTSPQSPPSPGQGISVCLQSGESYKSPRNLLDFFLGPSEDYAFEPKKNKSVFCFLSLCYETPPLRK